MPRQPGAETRAAYADAGAIADVWHQHGSATKPSALLSLELRGEVARLFVLAA